VRALTNPPIDQDARAGRAGFHVQPVSAACFARRRFFEDCSRYLLLSARDDFNTSEIGSSVRLPSPHTRPLPSVLSRPAAASFDRRAKSPAVQ
jgi:hypothetical protein